jgi:SAM-dependent methyltransferase
MNGPTFFELARQALTNTRRGYDLLAPKFEHTMYATPLDWIDSSLKRVEERFSLSSEGRGLDLACGTGRGVRALRQYCDHVDGLDFSVGMLEEAARLSHGIEGVEWICSDLHDLDLKANHYDRIVTYGAWGHILPSFRKHLLSEIVDSLKPGGVFLTLTSNEPRIWEKRFWYYLFFDLAIWVRNRIWFEEFHMYYRLNSTDRLIASLYEALETRSGYSLESEPLSDFEELPLRLVTIHRTYETL